MASSIILCTLNSNYQHTAFGLRYLYANLRELKPLAAIREFTTKRDSREIAEEILAENPMIVGMGVYIWNARESLEVARILKKVAPDVKLVLGGPEVSYETDTQEIVNIADHTIRGEGDFAFYRLCRSLLNGESVPRILQPELPDINQIKLPYADYNDEDIRNRIVYVEASRGCPYKCEYCLSSLDKNVRNFPLEPFLDAMKVLLERGTRQFKFIDRTFNLSPKISSRILQFFLEHIGKGLFLHFEMVPDRLPPELKEIIKKFPPGSLQFEIGIQTFNPEVARAVSRRNDYGKVEENFCFLRSETTVHTHADLIVGLPGENLESFARGFDRLFALQPDEIQIGLLKRLKGAPIARHDREYGMIYQDHPPFQVLKTKDLSFSEVQFMARYSKFWDLYVNSGHFPNTLKILFEGVSSPFHAFKDFVKFLNDRFPSTRSGISLLDLCGSLYEFLISQGHEVERVKACLQIDYGRNGKRTLPRFLSAETAGKFERSVPISKTLHIPRRQRNHVFSMESGSST